MKIEPAAAELDDVLRVVPFADSSDRNLASVCAQSSAGTILWTATDKRSLATIARGTVVEEGEPFAVPIREIQLAAAVCRQREASSVTFVVAGPTGFIVLPGINVTFASRPNQILGYYSGAKDVPHATALIELDATDLNAAIVAASAPPSWLTSAAREGSSLLRPPPFQGEWSSRVAGPGLVTRRPSFVAQRAQMP